MTAVAALCICIIWFLGGFINGVTSFGGNLIAAPLMTLIMEPKDAIIFSGLVGTGFVAALAVLYHHALSVRELILAVAGAIAGIPVGIMLLERLPSRFILLAAAGIILLFLLWQFISGSLHRSAPVPVWFVVPAGFVSGILFGSTSMGGPLLAIYGVLRGWNKETMLSMCNTMFALTMGSMVLMPWREGLYSSTMLHAAVWALPSTVIGVFASLPVIRRINQRMFRYGVFIMLALSAVMLLARSFGA